MKVVDWISWDESEGKDEAVGGLGGFFNAGNIFTEEKGYDEENKTGMRWQDYLDAWNEKHHPYLEALREAIVEGNIRRGGFWHQEQGVPVFEDGTIGGFSMRAWGDLMAAVWSEEEDKDYCYADFAWYSIQDDE